MEVTQILIIAIASLIVLLYAIWQVTKHGFRKTVVKLIVEAEKTFKSNEDKFKQVCEGLIAKLPFPANLMPYSVISNFVQKVFDEVKEALDYREE